MDKSVEDQQCLHVDEFYYYLVYVACAALGGVGQ
jgi:hypothetical protein